MPHTLDASEKGMGRGGLSRRLYVDLLNSILNEDLRAGELLPTEHELSRDYGVSRSTVRAGLAQLKDEGWVESRRGSGTYVSLNREADGSTVRRDETPMASMGSLRDLERCFECRSVIEGETAALAATRRTDSDLAYFRKHIQELRRLFDRHELSTSEDTDFHLRLATITGNPYFVSILSMLRPHLLFGMNISKTLPHAQRRQHTEITLREHEAIVEALINGDGEGARKAMQNHISRARERLFEGA